MDSTALSDFSNFLQKQWFEKAGLAAALIVSVVVAETLLISADAVWWLNLLAVTMVVITIAAAWLLSRRSPRTAKNKVGFLVSVACDNDEESKRLREDFLIPLQQLIKSGASGSAFHFMELPPHLSRHVLSEEDAQIARVRSRSHFMLYGRVRLRTIGGKEHHIIDLDGIVAHKTVPENVGELFANEFSELLPRHVRISTENDLFSFQFTSEWADVVAKYIIGIAAALSGDVIYAEKLFLDVQNSLINKNTKFPIYNKLAERVVLRLSELNESRANAEYQAWAEDHDASHIANLQMNLDKVSHKSRNIAPRVCSGIVNLAT